MPLRRAPWADMPDHNRNCIILDVNPPRGRKSYLLYYRAIKVIAEFWTVYEQ